MLMYLRLPVDEGRKHEKNLCQQLNALCDTKAESCSSMWWLHNTAYWKRHTKRGKIIYIGIVNLADITLGFKGLFVFLMF